MCALLRVSEFSGELELSVALRPRTHKAFAGPVLALEINLRCAVRAFARLRVLKEPVELCIHAIVKVAILCKNQNERAKMKKRKKQLQRKHEEAKYTVTKHTHTARAEPQREYTEKRRRE